MFSEVGLLPLMPDQSLKIVLGSIFVVNYYNDVKVNLRCKKNVILPRNIQVIKEIK